RELLSGPGSRLFPAGPGPRGTGRPAHPESRGVYPPTGQGQAPRDVLRGGPPADRGREQGLVAEPLRGTPPGTGRPARRRVPPGSCLFLSGRSLPRQVRGNGDRGELVAAAFPARRHHVLADRDVSRGSGLLRVEVRR